MAIQRLNENGTNFGSKILSSHQGCDAADLFSSDSFDEIPHYFVLHENMTGGQFELLKLKVSTPGEPEEMLHYARFEVNFELQ